MPPPPPPAVLTSALHTDLQSLPVVQQLDDQARQRLLLMSMSGDAGRACALRLIDEIIAGDDRIQNPSAWVMRAVMRHRLNLESWQ